MLSLWSLKLSHVACLRNRKDLSYVVYIKFTTCLRLVVSNLKKDCSILNVLRLLFSLKPKEMSKMRLLAIWIDQRQRVKIAIKKM